MVHQFNNAEGGTDETTVTTGNSGGGSGTAFDTVTIDTSGEAVFDTARAAHGSLSYRIGMGGTSGQSYVVWTYTSETEVWGRACLYLTADPSSTQRIVELRDSGGIVASVRLLTDGRLSLYDNGGTRQYDGGDIALNQWVRVEWHIVHSTTAGHMELRYYASVDGTTADLTLGNLTDNLDTGSGSTDTWFGITSATTSWTTWWDDLGITDVDWLGPVVSGINPPPANANADFLAATTASAIDIGPPSAEADADLVVPIVVALGLPGGGGDPGGATSPYGTGPRPRAHYELTLWQRTPQAAAAATYVEIGDIAAPTITWSHVLNADGKLDASAQPARLSPTVRTALLPYLTPDAAPQGLELRLLRTIEGQTTLEWAGPLVSVGLQGGTVTLSAYGLAYYLRYMHVATTDLVFAQVDQYAIATGMIDHYQALAYGNYGIDTSGIGLSGTLRDLTLLGAEAPNVYTELKRLADADNGFDWWIDPTTRALMVASSRGADLSASVILDDRNIVDPTISGDVAAGAFASEGHATGVAASTDAVGGSPPLTSTASDTAARQAFGRTSVAATFDGVSVQDTLDDHAQRLVDDHARPSFVPGTNVVPIVGADVGDFGPGDTIRWEYDAGLGLQTFSKRLLSVQVQVDVDGGESMAVEFL